MGKSKFPFDTEFCDNSTRPRGYKTFFMLNSVQHEILNAHKYNKYQEMKFGFYRLR